MGIVIGFILFIAMMSLFNGITHLSRDARQFGWNNPLTRKSMLVTLAGVALLALGFLLGWLPGHLK